MNRSKRIASRLRWILLSLWILCFVCGLIWLLGVYFDFGLGLLGTPALVLLGPFYQTFFHIFEHISGPYIPLVLIYVGLFFFTQRLFLSPRKLWKIKTHTTPRPMKKAAVGAAFAIALLVAGLGYSILDLFSVEMSEAPSKILKYLLISAPLILWILWSIVFSVYFRQTDYYTWSGRIIRGLVAGSVLELFVSIPIFATRQDDCYCERGSYASIIFGATVLLWAFGPGVFLLFLKEKHRIEKLDAMPPKTN